jgi:hypothetical protein
VRNGVTLLVLAAVGVIAAVALADALRPNAHSSEPAPPTLAPTRTEGPTVEVISPLGTRPRLSRNTCGAFRVVPSQDFPLLVVSVAEGDVTCRDARTVMKVHYVGLESDGWTCHGPEGRSRCEKDSGEAVSAVFADPLTSPLAEIEEAANSWARSFAANGHSCFRMTQPGCESVTCERVGNFRIPDCTPVTRAYRRSFARAAVEEIAVKGKRVAARFTNGELVEVVGVVGSDWMIHRVGWDGTAEVFE